MIFEGGKPRNPNDAEMHEIAGHPSIIKAQKVRAAYHKKRK
jgi:hypothetical protein